MAAPFKKAAAAAFVMNYLMVRIPGYERLRQSGLFCWKIKWLSEAQSPSNYETIKGLDRIFVKLFTKSKNIGSKEYP